MKTGMKTALLAIALLLLLSSCATAQQPRVLPPVPEDAEIAHPSVTALQKVNPEKAREREEMFAQAEQSPEIETPVPEEEVVIIPVSKPEPEPAPVPVPEPEPVAQVIAEPVSEIPAAVEEVKEIPVKAVAAVQEQVQTVPEAEPLSEKEEKNGAWPYILAAAGAAFIALLWRNSARKSSVKKVLNKGYTLLCLTGNPNSIIFARVRDGKIINEIKRTFEQGDTKDSRGYYKERVKLFVDKDEVVCFDSKACADMLFAATGEDLGLAFVDLKELAKQAFPTKTIETQKDFLNALSLPEKADPAASMNLAYRRILKKTQKPNRKKTDQ